VTVDVGLASGATIGHNLRATVADLERMREAAGQPRIRGGCAPARRDQAPQGGRACRRRRPAGAPVRHRGGRRRLRGRAPVRQPPLDPPPQTHRRRHGPAQLGRRRSAPEGGRKDEEGSAITPFPLGEGDAEIGPYPFPAAVGRAWRERGPRVHESHD
jgi:hypothetical protein